MLDTPTEIDNFVGSERPNGPHGPHCSDAERQARIDLAACYRLHARLGWTDLIYTHISARVPMADGQAGDHFLINPFGLAFDEVCASKLVKIDTDGNKLDDSPHPVHRAGFVIHSAVHAARPDAGCVVHAHTRAGMAISALECGLLPLTQHAMMFHGRVAYHESEGLANDPAERRRLGEDLGDKPVLPLISEKLPFDPLADLTPVGMVSRFPFVIAVSTQFGATTLTEVLARARAAPGDVAYASNGNGSMVQLGMELLAHQAQVKLNHVPYKGFAPAITDVVAGRVPLMLADWQPMASPVQAGSMKVLGVTSGQRSPLMPDVPTIGEQGFPGYDLEVWFGLYAPAATPPEIVARLGEAMRSWLSGAEARTAFARIGHEPAAGTPADIRARIAAERKSFAATIKAANIKAE